MSSETTVRVQPIACGWLTCGDAGFLLEGMTGEVRLPVPSYLIEHPTEGLAVFDTGLHPDLEASSDRIGSNAKLFEVDLRPGDTVGPRLASRGIDPADVGHVLLSHLHFDHCGGTLELPNARLVVQKPEWEAGHVTKLIEYGVYNPNDFDLGHDVLQLNGEHDLFGDGSVVCVPTPGHTAGHQSLRLRTAQGYIVLCADACYFRHALETMSVPSFGYNLEQQRESMRTLAALSQAGATLWFGHDEQQWSTLPLVV